MKKIKLESNEEILQNLAEYNKRPHTGIRCGLSNLDEIMRLDKQRLCIITSNENQGKTTFLNFYTYQMAKTNGFKTLFLTFENPKNLFYNKLKKVYEGNEFVNYCRYCDNEFETIEELFETIDYYKKNWGFEILIIDPFESLQDLMQGSFRSEDYAQLLERIRHYTQVNNILTIIAAHQKKLNDGEEPTINNIFGSVSFGNKADFIFSIQNIEDVTRIKTLKIRHNFAEGIKNQVVTFRFNPKNEHFTPTNSTDNDLPFGKEETITESQLIDDNQNFMFETKLSLYEGFEYSKDISLNDAILYGLQYRQQIDRLRALDKVKDEKEFKAIKKKLPCFTTAGNFNVVRDKDMIKKYSQMAVIDIDNLEDIDKAKEKVKQNPYVLYCAKSCSGRGLYCIVRLSGNLYEYSEQLKALFREFEILGFGDNLDYNCKDITRLRFVSYDERPYQNLRAKIFTKKIPIPTKQSNEQINADLSQTKELSKKDKQTLEKIIKDVKDNKLQLTKNHHDTMYLANVFASLLGEDGRIYLHTIRQQRIGYDSTKIDNLFDYALSNNMTNYSLGAIVAKYKTAKYNIN